MEEKKEIISILTEKNDRNLFSRSMGVSLVRVDHKKIEGKKIRVKEDLFNSKIK